MSLAKPVGMLAFLMVSIGSLAGCGNNSTAQSNTLGDQSGVANQASTSVDSSTITNQATTDSTDNTAQADLSTSGGTGDEGYYSVLNNIMTPTSGDVQYINQDFQTVESGSGDMSNEDLSSELQTDVQEYQQDISSLKNTSPASSVLNDDMQLVINSLSRISNDMSSMQQAADAGDQSGMDSGNQQIQSDYSTLQGLYTTDFTRMQQAGIQPNWNPDLYSNNN